MKKLLLGTLLVANAACAGTFDTAKAGVESSDDTKQSFRNELSDAVYAQICGKITKYVFKHATCRGFKVPKAHLDK